MRRTVVSLDCMFCPDSSARERPDIRPRGRRYRDPPVAGTSHPSPHWARMALSRPNTTSGTIHAGSCYYQQGIDNAHISTSSSTRAAQSHGWWLNKGGTYPSKSNVDTYLQAVYCTVDGCGWKTVDKMSGDVYAGGGSGKWITAHEGLFQHRDGRVPFLRRRRPHWCKRPIRLHLLARTGTGLLSVELTHGLHRVNSSSAAAVI